MLLKYRTTTIFTYNTESLEKAFEEAGEKLREISSKLNAMGPEINLGWSIAQSQK